MLKPLKGGFMRLPDFIPIVRVFENIEGLFNLFLSKLENYEEN